MNRPALCLAAVLLTGCAAAPAPPSVVSAPLIERELTLARPTDVRWTNDGHILITDLEQGIARFGISDLEPAEWLPEWPAGQGVGSRYMYLGLSERFVATADLAFGLRWRGTGADDAIVSQPIEYVADLDVHGDRLLLAGLRRDENADLGADGAFAWLASLPGGALRPILPFTDRGAIENCAGFHVATVRFLRDGSFVIVPGAEPGIYLYDAQGRLQRNVDVAPLNLLSECQLSRDEQSLVSSQPEARQRWINRHRIVDDVVELPSGPALIIRSRQSDVTRWELVPLGTTESRPLPFTSPSPWAHAAADARDGRVAVLVADQVPNREDGAGPRLIVWQP
ncbi:MAG TPA: hypothetical protein VEO54_27185 [Thermoanaerobaculia bacterium]|nr:hypothetical protein [Thermoanaerobaculia bacterium]